MADCGVVGAFLWDSCRPTTVRESRQHRLCRNHRLHPSAPWNLTLTTSSCIARATWATGWLTLPLKPQRTFAAVEGPQWPGEILVVESDSKPVLQQLLGSSQGFVRVKQAVAGCSVLRVFRKVVMSQALLRGKWSLTAVFSGHCAKRSQIRHWSKN